MIPEYYMTRHAVAFIYTFELIFSIAVLTILLLFYFKDIEKNSLFVFLMTGIAHSILELIAQGLRIRVITGAYVFGIDIGYPWICFVMGFFEGGVVSLAAYHFVKLIVEKSSFSIRFFTFLSVSLLICFILSAIFKSFLSEAYQSEFSITRRKIFNPLAVISMLILFTIPIIYFLFYKGVKPEDRITLFYYFIGLVLYTMIIIIPNHLMGVRYIEVKTDDGYMYASLIDQIIVMYGYNVCLESAGFLIQYYILIYQFKMIEFK